MANLQKVVKLTKAQYDTLASGGTVGSLTGLDDNFLYLVKDDSAPIIDITNGITAAEKAQVEANPGALLQYVYDGSRYIFVPNYDGGENLPTYYSSFAADEPHAYWINVD